ncbi:MAG TPA: GNAT family N-acetyltransferase [Pseudonocardiaceae bacterium]|nr:GNAT family N-acetyltransferase [Pseudonocardiaceae bacterium]
MPSTPENVGVDHVYQLERQCADAWPTLVDVRLGQWRLRAAGGFTGRANSALTTGDPGCPVIDALAEVRTFAEGNGIPPKAHVVIGAPLEPALAAAGWTVDEHHPGGAESVVLTGPLPAGPVPHDVTVPDTPPEDWWPLAVGSTEPTPAQRRVLGGARTTGFATARDADGRVIGIARGAVVGDLLHIARLAVAPHARRRGVATGLLAALAEWGARHDTTRCALQVATHNTAAIALYGRLGCRPHHRYRYWVPGPS